MQGKETENDCLAWGRVARLNTAVRGSLSEERRCELRWECCKGAAQADS